MQALAIVLMPVGWGIILASFKLFATGAQATPEFSTVADPSGIKRAASRVAPKELLRHLSTSLGVIANQRASRGAKQKAWGALGVLCGVLACCVAIVVFVAGLP